MPLDTILTFVPWHMTDIEAGPSRVAPTASERQRRVEDLSRVRGEASHVNIEHSVTYLVVGESVPVVEPATVPLTPYVLRALEDPILLESYSTHVASLIWQQGVFIYVFYVFVYLLCYFIHAYCANTVYFFFL